METELSQKQIDRISSLIKRRVPISNAMLGKIKKYGTMEQLVEFIKLEKQFGEPIELSEEDVKTLKDYKSQNLSHNKLLKKLQEKYI